MEDVGIMGFCWVIRKRIQVVYRISPSLPPVLHSSSENLCGIRFHWTTSLTGLSFQKKKHLGNRKPWLLQVVVSTHLKNIRQIGSFPQARVKNGKNEKYLKPPPKWQFATTLNRSIVSLTQKTSATPQVSCYETICVGKAEVGIVAKKSHPYEVGVATFRHSRCLDIPSCSPNPNWTKLCSNLLLFFQEQWFVKNVYTKGLSYALRYSEYDIFNATTLYILYCNMLIYLVLYTVHQKISLKKSMAHHTMAICSADFGQNTKSFIASLQVTPTSLHQPSNALRNTTDQPGESVFF